jgi:hypothetical protein
LIPAITIIFAEVFEYLLESDVEKISKWGNKSFEFLVKHFLSHLWKLRVIYVIKCSASNIFGPICEKNWSKNGNDYCIYGNFEGEDPVCYFLTLFFDSIKSNMRKKCQNNCSILNWKFSFFLIRYNFNMVGNLVKYSLLENRNWAKNI